LLASPDVLVISFTALSCKPSSPNVSTGFDIPSVSGAPRCSSCLLCCCGACC
jgi:hypothetical protein